MAGLPHRCDTTVNEEKPITACKNFCMGRGLGEQQCNHKKKVKKKQTQTKQTKKTKKLFTIIPICTVIIAQFK